MQHYYVSKHAASNGDHEMHVPRCIHLPEAHDRDYLGTFTSCHEALKQAKSHYKTANGCSCCCEECHSGSEQKAMSSV